jgi:GT2 family glycosyltransferase
MKPVAIVILTWNARRFTQACLRELRAITEHPSWRVIAVDNGSTDGTAAWLRALDGVTVIENGENLGFSRGCNVGIAAATPGEDIVLMNNDVLVTDPAWLTRLQEVAYADRATGVVGTRLVDDEGLISHLGAYMQPLTLRGQQIGGMELDVNQCARDRQVESVVFAQVYLRRDCIDKVGVLDEELFAYFEDTDYCLRAERAGFKVMCAGTSRAPVHVQNTSTRENAVDFWSIYNRSQEVFRRNWASWLENERYDVDAVWHSVLHQPMGYAVQSRKLMSALHFAGVKVAYRNAYDGSEGATEDLLIDDLVRRRPRSDVAQVAFCQADAFGRVKGRVRAGWSMLEVTGLPEAWVDGCNTMDEVWVPASFNVDTFENSGVRVPVRVMPLGVDIDYFNPQITGFRPSDRYTFLSVFEWGERKAPETLLRAFASEFKESEDVVLLLSVFNRDPDVNVEAEIARLDLPSSAPIVLMLNPEFADHQMGSLYRSADCFVLPTRGEGWGMPVLEAMACGLPTIATNWSGPADFLHEEIGYPLEVKSLVKAEARCPFYAGFEWAEPDGDHLRGLMREVFEAPDRARAKGLLAASEVAERYSWEVAARRVKERLLELV